MVDQTELLRWADSRGAQGDLPRLLRRLILETGRGVVRLGFPAGEGIGSGGWDGTVRATDATAYVPAGLSLWEVSAQKNAKLKANKDYAKRLATPDGSPTQECAYLAVSLRRWAKRSSWETEKAVDGRWKAIRAYGLDDIETWLESAPVTSAWLAEILGLHPHGLVAAESWWDTWSRATSPPFPAGAILAGRGEAIDALRAQLNQPGQIITVQGSSLADILAFVSAVGVTDAAEDDGQLLARTAFVDDLAAWRRLRDHRAPLALVPRTSDIAADLSAASPHHLIVPVIGSGPATITLQPIDSQKAKEALAATGFDEQRAAETAGLARLSLQAARRHIANKPELHRPPWAQPPLTRLVRRALLGGRWNEGSTADLPIVGNLLGAAYDSLREDLASLMSPGDPLMARFHTSVCLVSPFDAWLLMGGELRNEDLEAFKIAAITVFGEPDPALELPAGDRWTASLFGKTPLYSRDFRRGLATTLALLGAHGSAVIEGSAVTGQDWAASVVWEILKAANEDATCRIWRSLYDVLPLFAEAAPADFLRQVRDALTGEPPLLRAMFSDKGHNNSAHPSLQWALETCAWSPIEFGQAVDLLARFAEVDPGGQLGHRPRASLLSIFCPWYPQNSVSIERRLAVLDGLRERHRQIAWELMLSISRGGENIAMPTSTPSFRPWKPEQIAVTQREYRSFVDAVCQRLLTDVGADSARWVSVIAELPDLPAPVQLAARTQLVTLAGDDRLLGAARKQIWEALREIAARHREFADADWALPPEEVARIEEIAKRFEPSAASDRFAWLFEQTMPEIPLARRQEGLEEYEAEIGRLRVEAASDIAESLAWPQLQAFAAARKQPWILGWALARAGVIRHEACILALLDSESPLRFDFAPSYLAERFRAEGWPWVERHLHQGDLSAEQSGRLLLATHDFPTAWEVAETLATEVAAAFWNHFPTVGLGPEFNHVEFVAQRLLVAGRPGASLALLALYIRHHTGTDSAELMATDLEELLPRDPADPEVRGLSHYELVQIFEYLERSSLPRERLAALEWSYLPGIGQDLSPATLSSQLASSPRFFVDVISTVYRPRREETTDETETLRRSLDAQTAEKQQALARNAYRLLSGWRVLPGRREDGTIDPQALRDWVQESRRQLRERQRLEIGDIHIGQVLVSSPSDADGAWPCVEVRDLLETLQNTGIEEGLRTALFNRRGATSRRMLDGGDQERVLAAKYREQAEPFLDRWPRTAAVFRDLAEIYERHARHYEEDAEKRRTGLEQ